MVPALNAASHPLRTDLDHVLERTCDIWRELRGSRIFVTGGTGFIGSWLLEAFAWANRALELDARMVVLTRRPERFARRLPHVASDPAIRFHVGDVRTFEAPVGPFDSVIHGAAESSIIADPSDHAGMLDTIIRGTERTLALARRDGVARYLLLSSGAIYGRQPPELTHIPESLVPDPGAIDPANAYAEGKRAAERLCENCAKDGLPTRIARCFAFHGPYLPLEVHFAIGNFIADALNARPIQVTGDGTPVRGYLYAADLAAWLWTILVRGTSGNCYNVGSERAVTIKEAAAIVSAALNPPMGVNVMGAPLAGLPSQRYLPDTAKARFELGLEEWISLEDGVRRTLAWHRQVRGGGAVKGSRT